MCGQKKSSIVPEKFIKHDPNYKSSGIRIVKYANIYQNLASKYFFSFEKGKLLTLKLIWLNVAFELFYALHFLF